MRKAIQYLHAYILHAAYIRCILILYVHVQTCATFTEHKITAAHWSLSDQFVKINVANQTHFW